MTRPPSYPEDAPVGDPDAVAAPPTPPANPAAAEGGPPQRSDEPKRTKHMVAGAAIGIGSAALVAALLYANRSRRPGNPGR